MTTCSRGMIYACIILYPLPPRTALSLHNYRDGLWTSAFSSSGGGDASEVLPVANDRGLQKLLRNESIFSRRAMERDEAENVTGRQDTPRLAFAEGQDLLE